MAAIGGLQAIAPVPPASEMIDIILSGTMRRTPTVIRSGFNVSLHKAAASQRSLDHGCRYAAAR